MNRNKKWFYPEVNPKEEVQKEPNIQQEKGYACPCCGYLTLPVPQKEAVSYICPVCFWENDVFIQSAAEPSDENHGMTLAEAKENIRQFGACCEQMLSYVRKAFPEEIPKDHS